MGFATLPEAELKINMLFKETVKVTIKGVLLISRRFSMQGPIASSFTQRKKWKEILKLGGKLEYQ